MASSIGSILSMGRDALFANQAAIQTTGNNIANVDTAGYSRQGVRFEARPYLDGAPGQMGLGVTATEVYRMFNNFVEKAYVNKVSDYSRWSEQYALLKNVDALFYESESTPGIASQLSKFFDGWHQLSSDGALMSNREALMSDAQALTAFINEYNNTLAYMQRQMDGLIQADVDNANRLMQEIAVLNREINLHSVPGQNNPNGLLDQRDLKVRELAKIIDIDIINRGEGDFIINTKSGMPLVDKDIAYGLQFVAGPKIVSNYATGSTSTSTLNNTFNGSDEYEYTIDVIQGGTVGDPANPPLFRVSLDGGKTWMKDEDGNELHFPANENDLPVFVKDLEISFSAGTLTTGDTFDVMAKSGLYWDSPTTGLVNITPQTVAGAQNPKRTTGGTLASYFEFRDNLVGEYRERLDSFAKTLIWETNRIHSQGVGLEKLASVLGDYSVFNTGQALASSTSGFSWADYVQEGNFSLALYDSNGTALIDQTGMKAALDINFDPNDTTIITLSDGTTQVQAGSLEALVDKINISTTNNTTYVDSNGNNVPGPHIVASIVDGRLSLTTMGDTTTFAVGADSSGLLAGLGINTFFKGDDAESISVRDEVASNLDRINAAAVNGAGEGNKGDTSIALQLAQLANKTLSIPPHKYTGKGSEQTLVGFYATLVTKVGADTATAKYNDALYGAMAGDLQAQQDSTAGVNLDEEMTNLVKFQNSYKAAAKLITTADEMLQTILGLKQ